MPRASPRAFHRNSPDRLQGYRAREFPSRTGDGKAECCYGDRGTSMVLLNSMIRFKQGNLLDEPTEAVVNTVNTVGVMGKGIALMFKEAFPANFRAYEEACKRKEIQVGHMFLTENLALEGPHWLINFP